MLGMDFFLSKMCSIIAPFVQIARRAVLITIIKNVESSFWYSAFIPGKEWMVDGSEVFAFGLWLCATTLHTF